MAVKLKQAMTEDVYHKSYTRGELQEIRRTLAKATNQRAVRLERATSIVTGKKLSDYSVGAYVEYQALLKDGKQRISESLNIDLSNSELRREITQLQGILGMQSSSVGEFHKIERARQQSLMDKGLSKEIASNPKFYEFLNDKRFKEVSKHLDSDQIIEMIRREGVSSNDLDLLLDSFDEYLDGDDHSYKELINIYNAKQLE